MAKLIWKAALIAFRVLAWFTRRSDAYNGDLILVRRIIDEEVNRLDLGKLIDESNAAARKRRSNSKGGC